MYTTLNVLYVAVGAHTSIAVFELMILVFEVLDYRGNFTDEEAATAQVLIDRLCRAIRKVKTNILQNPIR